MSIRELRALEANTLKPVNHVYNDCLTNWNPSIQASDEASGNVISIYDVIGETYDGEGITEKRVAAALRKIGPNDVTVNINSPGGDYFMGIGIYNLLREHPHKVTVNIISLAASVASVIALAGDEINIAKTGQFMIHNAWGFAIGNAKAMRKSGDLLDHLDNSIIGAYKDKSGLSKEAIAEMMAEDTYLNGEDAVKLNFADGFLKSDKIDIKDDVENSTNNVISARKIEHSLQAQGLTRSERRSLMGEFKSGKQDATQNKTSGNSDDEILAGINKILSTLKKK